MLLLNFFLHVPELRARTQQKHFILYDDEKKPSSVLQWSILAPRKNEWSKKLSWVPFFFSFPFLFSRGKTDAVLGVEKRVLTLRIAFYALSTRPRIHS